MSNCQVDDLTGIEIAVEGKMVGWMERQIPRTEAYGVEFETLHSIGRRALFSDTRRVRYRISGPKMQISYFLQEAKAQIRLRNS